MTTGWIFDIKSGEFNQSLKCMVEFVLYPDIKGIWDLINRRFGIDWSVPLLVRLMCEISQQMVIFLYFHTECVIEPQH